MEGITDNIFWIKDKRVSQDAIHPYTEAEKSIPIIIDNGSYMCRVGWATDAEPRLVFRNCYAKQRKDRGKKNSTNDSEILVANDISNIEAVRFQLKSQYDENIVTHFEAQELMFDYIFTHLGVNTPTVNHPIVITEALANPHFSRQCMSELLFECYGVTNVSYCVDGLLSFHLNTKAEDGVVINIGNCSTYIMPILNGFVVTANSRRIRIGGQHLVRYLWRWLQLKYPQHLNAITLSRAENILYSNMHISENYMSELSNWADPDYFDKNVTKIQLPFSAQPVTTLSAEQLKERKREAAKRLADVNAKKREERLEEDEQELARLVELEEAMEEFTPDEAEYQHALDEAQVNTLQELQTKTSALRQRIEKLKLKIQQANTLIKDDEIEEPKPKRVNLSIPSDAEEREKCLEGIKQQWRDIHARKTARKNRRQEMAKRRTAASQERMRIISQLAKREKKEDNFGMRDEDWDVYKAINKDSGGSDSEEDDEKLQELETILKHHSPEFLGETTTKPISIAENYQLLLSIEKIRIGELLFQPSMYGIEQGGISSCLEYVLNLHSEEEQSRLVNNVFVTGATAKIPGLKKRLEKDLLTMRPFQSNFNVYVAKDPELDPWLGARAFSTEILENGMSEEEYKSLGGGFLKKHKFGNEYWTPEIPPQTVVPEVPKSGQ
ncbi:UNVERIFIED_CONTAM: hypothetical protein RMT77_006751 [Armadillidium vulgare]